MQSPVKFCGDKPKTRGARLPKLCKCSAGCPGCGRGNEGGGQLPALQNGLFLQIGRDGSDVQSFRCGYCSYGCGCVEKELEMEEQGTNGKVHSGREGGLNLGQLVCHHVQLLYKTNAGT